MSSTEKQLPAQANVWSSANNRSRSASSSANVSGGFEKTDEKYSKASSPMRSALISWPLSVVRKGMAASPFVRCRCPQRPALWFERMCKHAEVCFSARIWCRRLHISAWAFSTSAGVERRSLRIPRRRLSVEEVPVAFRGLYYIWSC